MMFKRYEGFAWARIRLKLSEKIKYMIRYRIVTPVNRYFVHLRYSFENVQFGNAKLGQMAKPFSIFCPSLILDFEYI